MTAKRATQSEAKIRAAFITLMGTKGFDAMTVSDIAREAGVNRGTFYMHYLDKYDLRQRLIDDEVETIASMVLDAAPDRKSREHLDPCDYIPYDAILAALTRISDEYEFFAAITVQGADTTLYDRMKDILKNLVDVKLPGPGADGSDSSHGIPRPYAQEILASAVSSILWLWLRRGCKESPEQIASIIERNKTLAPVALIE
ncbi:TetR/AcrR family transcriptional regulator [Bifidobacterium eulemuris]|uniref:TetR family transcriptional regulator n=1 Tax=Bifidobacterium eulemuris TaxID=1765219 RepID=A0A261GCP3_9BIFI|nr:TetR/AcrR family transcriptional regulator [Bifidobacterium eulemuris]OZG69219.1 TetR family transcriptional regulator [Bifidobacterium eulemuris]QOL31272.1 TetR/AcrR family transcriptional regulator [Bifidobacterium eulemuris]